MQHNKTNTQSYLYIILITFCVANVALSQNILTLEEARTLALNNNLDIQAANLEAKSAGMQVYKANAGLLPRIDWNFNSSGSFNKVNLEFIDGRTLDRYGRSFAPGSNVSLNWTIYDGNRMQNRYDMLKKQSEFANVAAKQTTEELLNSTTELYYSIARQKYLLEFLRSGLRFYQERLSITEERWKVGRGSKLDYLQSQNDLNSQLAAIQNGELALTNMKVNMNLLLNRTPDLQFETEDIKADVNPYTYDQMLEKAVAGDETLQLMEKSIELNTLNIKDWQGSRMPRVGFTTALGYNYSQTNAGQILNSQTLGINGALTATWNLFDGGHTHKQIEIAKQQGSILETRKALQVARIKTNVTLALQSIKAAQTNLNLEEQNKVLAEENLSIALEKFKLGASTILELNDAQQRYDASIQRFIDAVFALHFAKLNASQLIN